MEANCHKCLSAKWSAEKCVVACSFLFCLRKHSKHITCSLLQRITLPETWGMISHCSHKWRSCFRCCFINEQQLTKVSKLIIIQFNTKSNTQLLQWSLQLHCNSTVLFCFVLSALVKACVFKWTYSSQVQPSISILIPAWFKVCCPIYQCCYQAFLLRK